MKKIFGIAIAAVAAFFGIKLMQGDRTTTHTYDNNEARSILQTAAKAIATLLKACTIQNGAIRSSMPASDKKVFQNLLINSYGLVEDRYKELTGYSVETAFTKLLTSSEQTVFRSLASQMSNTLLIANSTSGAAQYGTHSGSIFGAVGSVQNGQYIGRMISEEDGYVTVYVNGTKYWIGASDVVKVNLQ